MSSNIEQFKQRLNARKVAVPGMVAKRHREITQFALDEFEAGSPVDTGDFHRAWEPVMGERVGGVLGEARSGDAGTADEKVPELEPFSLVQIVNRDPAGPRIENGWSDQAPRGVLSITAMRVREFVRKKK